MRRKRLVVRRRMSTKLSGFVGQAVVAALVKAIACCSLQNRVKLGSHLSGEVLLEPGAHLSGEVLLMQDHALHTVLGVAMHCDRRGSENFLEQAPTLTMLSW
jgi:hypothetical protein